jgi:hypothetical protein
MSATETAVREDAAGLEDVVRSVRTLARMSRGLAESAALVAERELAMAIDISEKLRDSVISAEALRRARAEDLPARLRQDAHRALDLVADIGAIAYTSAISFVESFADRPRANLAAPPTVAAAGQP